MKVYIFGDVVGRNRRVVEVVYVGERGGYEYGRRCVVASRIRRVMEGMGVRVVGGDDVSVEYEGEVSMEEVGRRIGVEIVRCFGGR